MKDILKLNEISPVAGEIFTKEYNLTKESKAPIGILLRSFAMHEYPLNPELLAVARAGAGVNNIPIDKCTQEGIVVFNTPGANANAVKELVIAAMLLSSRKIIEGIAWANSLKGKEDVPKLVEKGKGNFGGHELAGKRLGVIGLGAIGAMVADYAIDFGMEVMGFDPFISVDNAWALSRKIKRITNLDELISSSDFISLHIPLTGDNKNMFDDKTFAKMKTGSVLINCSRGELVNNKDLLQNIKSGKLSKYVTDFPCEELLGEENIICIPHLGASTEEAEDNCAVMAAQQLRDYIENGNIKNSVNYPACEQSRTGVCRVAIHHLNKKNVISNITSVISKDGINIENFVDKSKGEYAYCLLDLSSKADDKVIADIKALDDIIRVRVLD